MNEIASDFDVNGSQVKQWDWDGQNNSLCVVDQHLDKPRQRNRNSSNSNRTSLLPLGEQARTEYKTKFLEVTDPVEQIKFRRHFMRRSKPNEVDVITLQDVKDVVLYLLITPIPSDFIKFFHTSEVDNFLRGLILYFQYYLEIWEDVQYRTLHSVKRLKHPVGFEREEVVKEHLSELRCIVARDYSLLLLGSGKCKRFHHMANKQRKSIAERDLKLFEYLLVFATRVVWIALNRQSIGIIENELHRLFRSDYYNTISKRRILRDTSAEHEACHRRVLEGNTIKERKLFVRSPLMHEVSVDKDHSYELLQIGIVPIVSITNERLMILQDAYTLTEEYLENSDLSVGILGHVRESYEPLLQPKEKLIGTVKRYKISSGLPGIFLARLTQVDSQSGIKEAEGISGQETSSKTSPEKELHEAEEEEEIQIIVRSKEYYRELHKQRNLTAKKMWLKNRSISGSKNVAQSKTRKYSAGMHYRN